MEHGEMMMMMMMSSNNNHKSKGNRRHPHRQCNLVGGSISVFCCVIVSIQFLLFLLLVAAASNADKNSPQQKQQQPPQHHNTYTIIGVSGGLQKGFSDHSKLNYYSSNNPHAAGGGEHEVVVQAVFLGRALVRGYKAYLDVMEPTHRQYIASANDDATQQQQPPLTINSNVIPTGCWHHANEYWMYLVDTRQALNILMNEPRFLSITPDHGLVDLTVDETSPLIKHIAQHEIHRQSKTDYTRVALPIVTGVWYNPTSHVPSPVLYTKPAEDGTEVTNFPQSLLKWIGMDPQILEEGTCPQSDVVEAYVDTNISTPLEIQHYWSNVTQAIRRAEANRRPTIQVNDENAPWTLGAACIKKAQFGTSPQQARVNYSFHAHDFRQLLQTGGYDIDYVTAKVSLLYSNVSSEASSSLSTS